MASAFAADDPRIHAILESIGDAFIVADARGMIVHVNDALGSHLGYEPSSLLGRPLTDIVPARLRSDHRRDFERYLTTGMRPCPGTGVELLALHRDGGEVPVEVTLGTTEVAGERYVSGTLRVRCDADRAARWLATHRWVAARYHLSCAIAESTSLEQGIPRILQAVTDAIGWDLGEFWLPDEARNELRCVGRWQAMAPHSTEGPSTCVSGAHLPGMTWRDGTVLWLADPARLTGPTGAWVDAEGLRTGLGVPVHHAERLVGVLTLYTLNTTPDDGLRALAPQLAGPIGEFLSRLAAVDVLRHHREERLRSLGEHDEPPH